MNDTLGRKLGGFLAILEESLVETGCDDEPLAQMQRISEIYRNLSQGGFDGFQHDFREGYDATKRDVVRDRAANEPVGHSGFPSPDNG